MREKLEGTKRKFKLNTVSPRHVLNIVNQLKSKKSCGNDGITAEIPKLGSEVLCLPLAYIIHTSIKTGKYPTRWKIAKLIPVHQKNDWKSLKNYRPVALLPVAGMVLEKIVALQIEKYFEENNLFGSFKFGFRKKKCYFGTTFWYTLGSERSKKGNYACVVWFVSAFDTISHEILFEKLKLYGFDENSLSWVQSYLMNRDQYVTLSGERSSALRIDIWTPKGSRLSPLLFLCLMADIRVIQNFTFRKFISVQAFSCSFGKWNAENSKKLWNRTTFRWCSGPSKFYYIPPLMNYSQYSLEGYKILV